jgi:hypothetical protein
MKKLFIFLIAAVMLASCAKQEPQADLKDQWNGYQDRVKDFGSRPLWAAQTIQVGTVNFYIDYTAEFVIRYELNSPYWVSETHAYAGSKENMPLNKPGTPKVGRFPYSGTHASGTQVVEYRVPVSLLPPDTIGFVFAAHCVVQGPSFIETGWAEGPHTYCDKQWGWYDDVQYWTVPTNTVLYGTSITQDGYLEVYHMNMDAGTSSLIVREYVGGTSGDYDASAFDVESGKLYFTKDGADLWVNDLQDESESFQSGTLTGIASSATFADGYYYVDEITNEIRYVTFDQDYIINSETTLVTIPEAIVVNDIAMSPEGDYLYMVGTQFGGAEELMSWQVGTDNFYSYATNVDDMQIAFGTNGELYGVAPDPNGGNDAFIIDTDSGTATEITTGGGGWGGGDGDDDERQFTVTDLATGMPF